MDAAIWVEIWRKEVKKAMKLEPKWKKNVIASGGMVVFIIPMIISPFFFLRWGDVLAIQNNDMIFKVYNATWPIELTSFGVGMFADTDVPPNQLHHW